MKFNPMSRSNVCRAADDGDTRFPYVKGRCHFCDTFFTVFEFFPTTRTNEPHPSLTTTPLR